MHGPCQNCHADNYLVKLKLSRSEMNVCWKCFDILNKAQGELKDKIKNLETKDALRTAFGSFGDTSVKQ